MDRDKELEDAWLKGYLYGSAPNGAERTIWAGLEEFKDSKKKAVLPVSTGDVDTWQRPRDILPQLRRLFPWIP